jgi:hypothetical protein
MTFVDLQRYRTDEFQEQFSPKGFCSRSTYEEITYHVEAINRAPQLLSGLQSDKRSGRQSAVDETKTEIHAA